MIYLTNPMHGTHIVYSQEEADTLVKIGWTIRDEAEIHAMARKPSTNPLADSSVPKRRGRKPKGVTP